MMKIGTAEKGSTFEAQGLALQDIMRGVTDTRIINPRAASIENAQSLHEGMIDFGFMAANWIGLARRGEPPFKQPIDLRLVAPMNAGPMFFIARADSKLHTVRDLVGKRIAVGGQMSGIAQHARSLFDALDLNTTTDVDIVFADFETGAQMLARGEIDAQLQCPIPNAVMNALDHDIDLRILTYSDEDMTKVLTRYSIYRTTLMRKGSLRALHDNVLQPAVINVLVTHARQPIDDVSTLTRCIYEHRARLPQLCALFGDMDALFAPAAQQGPRALEFEGVSLHQGALHAYRAAGLLS
jgi:TRAP transporter TAXI family solute receptor